MKSCNEEERRKKLILFSTMLVISMGLVFLLATSLSNQGSNQASAAGSTVVNSPDETDRLIAAGEKLQSKLLALQQLDQVYAAAIAGDGFAEKSDSLNRAIANGEQSLNDLISGMTRQQRVFNDEKARRQYVDLLAGYKAVLEARKAVGQMRTALALQGNGFSADEKDFLTMKNELQEKKITIASLEHSLRAIDKSRPLAAPEKNDYSPELLNRLDILQNSVDALTAGNNHLKQENERLKRQQDENVKYTGSNETLLKEKANALAQKVDALNAALQLAQVDCNISRVDAAQIISNSKQRTALLSEASRILTNLSASGNEDVRKKVKEKIVQLNVVAADYRQ